MAQNATSDIHTRETVVLADHSHDDGREGGGLGGVIIAVLVILALILLFVWNPFRTDGDGSGTTNVNVDAPSPAELTPAANNQ